MGNGFALLWIETCQEIHEFDQRCNYDALRCERRERVLLEDNIQKPIYP